MNNYPLQKLIRVINRDAQIREAFMADPEKVASEAGLPKEHARAVASRDYRALYRLGVHGLLLRPFSIIHGVSEPDYLSAIRGSKQ